MWRSKNSHIDETTMRRLDSASSEVHQSILMCLVEEILGNHFRDLPFMVNRASNASGNLALVLVAICTGLRVSEILALRWSRIHFDRLTMIIKVKAVNGRIGRVKTEWAEDELPLDPDFAAELLGWKAQCRQTPGDSVFPSPVTDRCYHASPIQQDYIRPAALALGIEGVGWHTFRHTYRSWLDDTGAVGVQQKPPCAGQRRSRARPEHA